MSVSIWKSILCVNNISRYVEWILFIYILPKVYQGITLILPNLNQYCSSAKVGNSSTPSPQCGHHLCILCRHLEGVCELINLSFFSSDRCVICVWICSVNNDQGGMWNKHMNIEQIKQLQRRISPNHVTEAQVVLPLLTCSDLRSCQVYGSKIFANIEEGEQQ